MARCFSWQNGYRQSLLGHMGYLSGVHLFSFRGLSLQQTQRRRFLWQTGNSELAVEWLFSHPDNTGADSSAAAPATAAAASDIGGSQDLLASYNNAFARTSNSLCQGTNEALVPLVYGITGAAIPNFPRTIADLNALAGEISPFVIEQSSLPRLQRGGSFCHFDGTWPHHQRNCLTKAE